MFPRKQSKMSYGGNITLLVYAPIARKNPSVVINTDASSFGSRVSLGLNKRGGQFSTEESQQQINILELKATRFGLKSLCKNEFDSHILIQIDNTSAVSATNKMGVWTQLKWIMKCILYENS